MAEVEGSEAVRRLSDDEVALVLRRASELATPGAPEGLDERRLAAAAQEAGLPEPAVHQALRELHAGMLVPPPARPGLLGPRMAVAERHLAGPVARVERELAGVLRATLLRPVRHGPGCSRWVPDRGLPARVEATVRSARDGLVGGADPVTGLWRASAPEARRRLAQTRGLEVRLAEVGDGTVAVRLCADCSSARLGMTAGAVGGMGLGGLATVSAAVAAVVTGDPLPLLAVIPSGGLAGGALAGARVAYSRRLDAVELVLEGLLDRLAGPGQP